MTRKSSAYTIAITGILAAMIIMQAYIPMVGYIRITPLWPAISTIHLTVILAGILLGVRGGAGLGAFWGCVSLIKAYTDATDPVTILLFRNPLIAILPRIMVGVVAGLVFNHIAKKHQKDVFGTIKMSLAGVCGALTNTSLVIALTWVFFANNANVVVKGADGSNLGWLLIGALAINAIAEALLAGILVPILGQALLRFKR